MYTVSAPSIYALCHLGPAFSHNVPSRTLDSFEAWMVGRESIVAWGAEYDGHYHGVACKVRDYTFRGENPQSGLFAENYVQPARYR